MNKKNKFRKINVKVYIIPLIIITLAFIIMGYTVIREINNYYFKHMMENSLRLAKDYSHSLSKAIEAYEVVNGLLEDKLLVANQVVGLYEGNYTNELLNMLAKRLEIDKIYLYDSRGRIVYSNTEEYIGWEAYEGHPVYEFMESGRTNFIGEIRANTENGLYYKYGYFKLADGSFVQTGVIADKVHSFLGKFEIQQILEEIGNMDIISYMYFIDNDFNIVGSTGERLIGKEIIDEQVRVGILEDNEHGFTYNNKRVKQYETFIPIKIEGNKLGTIAIVQSLKDTYDTIRKVSLRSMLIIIVIYAAVIYMIMYKYSKEKRLIQSVYYDNVSGLPNERYLREFLDDKVIKEENLNSAIILINCINFRVVNMAFGYEYGDKILKLIGERLKEIMDSNLKLFRFTGDQFIIYIKNYKNLNPILNSINDKFINPFIIENKEQQINIQMAIVELNGKYSNSDKILKDASVALNYIKNNAATNFIFFDKIMEKKLKRENLIERELRLAIQQEDKETIYLEFQPQLDLKTNKIICFETLARMNIDSIGNIFPIEFIPIAEGNHLIVPLGDLILKRACDFIVNLKDEGYKDIKVAVNISGIQLLQDDFIDKVMEIINERNISGDNLELEITESVLLNNYEKINKKLKTLRNNNIKIALDDFGTGYSSLARLRELNIDTIKIDRYFVNKLREESYTDSITADIISMAYKLGLNVVTEGVEFEEQRIYLKNKGCNIIQGFLISRPLKEKDAIALVEKTL